MDIELAEPLGERRLTVVQRSDSWVGREGFCIEAFENQGCLEFDLQTGSQRIPTFEPVAVNPTDVVIGSGATTPLAMGDLTIEVTTSVVMDEPVFTAFDPVLLSENALLYGAASETEVCTAISDWSVQLQSGIETWYVGAAEDPRTVATYVRNDDGTWNTESALTCQ